MELGTSLISGLSGLVTRLVGDRAASRHGPRRKLPWAANKKLAGRLKEIIGKASSKDRPAERTVAYVCEQVEGLSLASVESFMHGAAEPTLDQARSICAVLGASFAYLWRGDGQPFTYEDVYHPWTREYLGLFRAEGVQTVLFVRGNRMPHPAFAVLQYNEFKYRVLPNYWHVSSENGGGGASELNQLAQLIMNIHRTRTYQPVIRGIEVPSRIAIDVHAGVLHPSALWSQGWKPSDWWDDLADVDHQRACARHYASRYDDEFFAAQKIIKWAREPKNA